MSKLHVHTIESAPQASKPLLQDSFKSFGMIPNLHGVLANSPELLEAYKSLHQWFESTSLSTEEKNVVWLAINVENECHYCIPAHTMIALKSGVSESIVADLKAGRELENPRLEALRSFTVKMVRQRGQVSQDDVQAFYDSGYTQKQVLEVILGIAQKTVSNYTNHIADTAVDEPFKAFI